MSDLTPSSAPDSGLVPPPVIPIKVTLWDEIKQGWAFVRFALLIAQRINGGRNRIRFVVGLIFWKPFLPDNQD